MKTDSVQGYHRSLGTDPADLLVTKLEAAGCNTSGPGNGGEYSSQCPAHQDQVASLRWRISADGRALIHCHAGCEGSEIIKALGVKWHQLRPTTVAYEYFDTEGTYLYTVKRTNTAGGGKTFKQFRQAEDGTIEDGRGAGPDVLWLAPLLHEWSQDRLGSGDGSLWLVEGEKDVVVAAEWMEDNEFVTTAPGGAGGWKPGHTDAVREVVRASAVSSIVLVGDRDAAGVARLIQLTAVFEAEFPDVAVARLVPDEDAGADLSELIDRYGGKWREQLVDASETEASLMAGTGRTGGLLRVPEATLLGAMVIGWRQTTSKGEVVDRAILDCDLVVTAQSESGWYVKVISADEETQETWLARSDLAGGRNLGPWLAKHGIARVTGSGATSEVLAGALPAFLKWDAKMRNAPVVIRSEYYTWVDADTGEPAKYKTERMAFIDHNREPLLYVGGDGPSVRGAGTDIESQWGFAGNEMEAAWAMARALTFAVPEVTAMVAGWAASQILAPWFAPYLSLKPGLAVVSASNTGKSIGATRLLLQLIGTPNQLGSSDAGFRRHLAAGVSVIPWLDDSDIIGHTKVQEYIRIATARSDFQLADTDQGLKGISTVSLVGSPVVSAEAVSWIREPAMMSRFVMVKPPSPQNRTSLYPGREGQAQIKDLRELEAQYDQDLSCLAGWIVAGLAGTVGRLDKWVAQVNNTSNYYREETPYVAVAFGVRALATVLTQVREEAGKAWPGAKWDPIHNEWGWIVQVADRALAGARDRIGADDGVDVPWMVSTMIPALMEEHAVSQRSTGMQLVAFMDKVHTRSDFGREVHKACSTAGFEDAGRVPIVLVNKLDGRCWVRLPGLHEWYYKQRYGKTIDRQETLDSMVDQMRGKWDDPTWSGYSYGAGKNKPGMRVEVDGVKYTWLCLRASHSEIVLGGRSLGD